MRPIYLAAPDEARCDEFVLRVGERFEVDGEPPREYSITPYDTFD